MLLTLTIQTETNNQTVDIQVNSDNKIKDTLQLLTKKNIVTVPGNIREVYSIRNKEFTNTENSYEQGKIYTGDILRITDR